MFAFPTCTAIAWLALAPSSAPSSDLEASLDANSARESAIDARLDVSHLYTTDDQTSRHRSHSDVRALVDATDAFSIPTLELHADARARASWNDVRGHEYEITRAYMLYPPTPGSWLAAGRMTIDAVASTQVDGAQAGLELGADLRGLLFAGLMPHPMTGDFDVDFANLGFGYANASKTANRAGGVSLQLHRGSIDRVFVTQRVYERIGQAWTVFGNAIVDFAGRSGVIGTLNGTEPTEQSFFERVNLTNGSVAVRFVPAAWFDIDVGGSHTHTLLPNRWWEDWISSERSRLGFSIDGPFPQGTRRSNAHATTAFHVGVLSPYTSARVDVRHEDKAFGYEGTLGLKYNDADLGFADLSGTYREYFEATHQVARLQVGTEFLRGLNVDAAMAALRATTFETNLTEVLYDVSASVWFECRTLSEALDGLSAFAMVQTFIEPKVVEHALYLRMAYRFGS